jgi:hypothetical protein
VTTVYRKPLTRTTRTVNEFIPKAGPVKITHADGTVSIKGALTFGQRKNLMMTGDKRERRRVPKKQRQRILERDMYRCVHCGTKTGPFQMDHLRPYSKGGLELDSNLVTACVPCNRKRGNKWTGKRRATP